MTITAEIISNNNGVLELYIIDSRSYIVVSAFNYQKWLKDKLVKGAIIKASLTKDKRLKRLNIIK